VILFYFLIQSEWFTEVKDVPLATIDEIKKTSRELKKAFEQYYFPDKELVS
jgi:hypothetical protein